MRERSIPLNTIQVDERDVEGNMVEKVVCLLDDRNLSYILFAFTGSSMVPSPAPSSEELIKMIFDSFNEGYSYLWDICSVAVSYTLYENGVDGFGDTSTPAETSEVETSFPQKPIDMNYLDPSGNEIKGIVTINGIDEDGKVSSYDCVISSFKISKRDEMNDYSFSGRAEVQLEGSDNYYFPFISSIDESMFNNRNNEFGSFSDSSFNIDQDEHLFTFSCLTYNGKKLEIKYTDYGVGEPTVDNISITLDGIPQDPSILS